MINFQGADQDQQSEINDAKQKMLKNLAEYTYCMVSTLNQMVNYLPMLLFPQIEKKLYITLEDQKGKENKNKPFDDALKAACYESSIPFPDPSEHLKLRTPYDTSSVQTDIKGRVQENSKICWNITGGQRPILMAILEIAKQREGDYIMYLEGNEGKLVIQESDGNGNFKAIDLSTDGNKLYRFEETEPKTKLTVGIALRLMGIKEYGQYTAYDGNNSDVKALLSLGERYRKEERLRKQLLALNREKDLDKTDYKSKAVLQDDAKAAYYFSTLNPDELYQVCKHKDETFPFGHLLEELYAAAIYEAAKGNIAEMAVNLRLRPDDEAQHGKGNKKQTDEIDLIILTKTGQLVVFEVKSGSMDGDVAKSTKYTTYAIAGVYGKPILLTALLKKQLIDPGKLSGEWPYETSAIAVRSANRAQLPIIALDGDENHDFEPAIKNLLHL